MTSKIIHVRWSGEASWIPFGHLVLGLITENATSYPHPGEVVLYPGGVSEGNQHLRDLGAKFLWEGAQDINLTET